MFLQTYPYRGISQKCHGITFFTCGVTFQFTSIENGKLCLDRKGDAIFLTSSEARKYINYSGQQTTLKCRFVLEMLYLYPPHSRVSQKDIGGDFQFVLHNSAETPSNHNCTLSKNFEKYCFYFEKLPWKHSSWLTKEPRDTWTANHNVYILLWIQPSGHSCWLTGSRRSRCCTWKLEKKEQRARLLTMDDV